MNLSPNLKVFLSLLLLSLVFIPAMAQEQVVRGTVFEADGKTPVIGANVVLKGTTVGTTTNIDGAFNLKVSGSNPVLVFQFIGYARQEVPIGTQQVIKVTLQEDLVQVDEVVVTALGLTREQKSLGYSVSKVDNEELTKTVSGNWLNAMSGKVAGLVFDQASSSPSGSKRVTLRGDVSLNYGSNEALFVIDGVPVTSGTTANSSSSNYAAADAPIDFGNGASDINPDDIASVSVLKGPAATALYGSRAANGAIIITTKSGRKDKGIGVTVNSSVTFDRAGYFPDFQKEYGNGSDLGENEYSMWELSSDMAPDGIATPRRYSRYTFGEKYDPAKLRYLYASKNWETNEYTKLPWVYQDDWYTGLFQTGITKSNTVTIDGSNGEGTNTRLSFTDLRNDWIMPNTGFQRQSVSLSFNSKINQYIKLNAKVNYYRKQSDNMPGGGYDETNAMYALVWGQPVNSIKEWKKEYFEGRFNTVNWEAQGENGNGLVFPSANSYNPYRTLYEELNSQNRNRVFGSVGLTFDLAKGLTLDLKSGLDWTDEFRTQRKPFYTTDFPNGFYREQNTREYEFNSDFMLRYENNEQFDNRLGFSVMVGGNSMTSEYYNNRISLSQLDIDGVYHLSNLPSGINPDIYTYRSKKMINSLYGLVSLSWNDTYFLDLTARNDWSSTLAPKYWSFFYPSVAASVLLDKALNLQESLSWLDFMKLRVSWANVGNGTTPYSLDQYYGTTSFPGGYVLPGAITDPLIKPENVESWELGLEGKFLQNRVSFDLAIYDNKSTNQITTVDLDQITGATGMKINVGEVQNRGIEVLLSFVPVRSRNFNWNFDVNWSKNKNKLISLADDWDPTVPWQTDMGTTVGSRTFIYSYVGQEMHVIYGRGYQQAPEGSTYMDENGNEVDASGMDIVNASGYPVLDGSPTRKIGNVNPDWRAGMTHRFSYKNLSLSASFSAQYGGNAFSVTNFSLSYQGKLKNSLDGRNDGLVHPGVNEVKENDVVVGYTKNTNVTSSIQTYYNSNVWNRDNTMNNTFDTSFLKLKEVRLDYNVPAKLLRKTGFLQKAGVGVFATNLFCWTDFPQYDPETGMLNGNQIYKGIEVMSFPMTRSYGVNVNLSF